jgi:hypothetical protein
LGDAGFSSIPLYENDGSLTFATVRGAVADFLLRIVLLTFVLLVQEIRSKSAP